MASGYASTKIDGTLKNGNGIGKTSGKFDPFCLNFPGDKKCIKSSPANIPVAKADNNKIPEAQNVGGGSIENMPTAQAYIAPVATSAGKNSDTNLPVANPVALASATPDGLTKKLIDRVSDAKIDPTNRNASANQEIEARIAAAKPKYDALLGDFNEKIATLNRYNEDLRNAMSYVSQLLVQVKSAEQDKLKSQAAFEGSPEYFLVVGMNDGDKAALTKLYNESLTLADAKTRAATNIANMNKNLAKSTDEYNQKQAELDKLQDEISSSVDALQEYTAPHSEVKAVELSGKQSALAAAQAKQAELTAAVADLTSKASTSDAKIKQINGQISTVKALKEAGKAKLPPLLDSQKAEAKNNADIKAKLADANGQLGLVNANVESLQNDIKSLQDYIAALPAAAPGADDAGDLVQEKIKRLAPLRARISALKATQDPNGKLQASLKAMQVSLADLEAKASAKQDEIRDFKDKIIAQRAANAPAAQ